MGSNQRICRVCGNILKPKERHNINEDICSPCYFASVNLNVSRNEITDISALLEIDSLREVHLGENPLGDDAIDLHIPQLLSKGVEVHLD